MREKALEVGIVGFVVGIAVRSYLPIGFPIALSLLLFSVVLMLSGFFSFTKNRILYFYIPLALVAAVGGVARYELSLPRGSLLDVYAGKQMSAEGVIVAEPDTRETQTFLTVRLDVLTPQGTRLSDRVRVAVDKYPTHTYGERINISGVLKVPEDFQTDTGRLFDYQSYLAKDGIYYEFFKPKIEVRSRDAGNPIVAALFSFKQRFLDGVAHVISEPENSLLAGLILGDKHGLGKELNDTFRRAGVVHIVVLSGYNLTIVAYALMWVFAFLPLYAGAAAGALGIIAFTIMAGASATALRAAIMALIVILSKIVRRDYDINRALFIAGFLMIAHNPKILAFDPSFQLSFLAALGLVYLSPFFKRWLRWVPEQFGVREIVCATLATQTAVLPLLANLSGNVSIVGILANILILPFVPITMLFGALTGFAALFYQLFAIPFAYISYLLLHYEIFVARFFGDLSFATVSVPALPVWAFAINYLALGFLVWKLRPSYFASE